METTFSFWPDTPGYKGKSLVHDRDFTLTVVAGLGLVAAEVLGVGPPLIESRHRMLRTHREVRAFGRP